MGVQDIHTSAGGDADRRAMRRVLSDLDALERMLGEDRFETDRRRIGAEQELVLVDRGFRPAPVALEVLEAIDDARVVPEIARFNIEFNCDPVEVGPGCLSSLEAQIHHLYARVAEGAAAHGAQPLITGICPTLELAHLGKGNIFPRPRYHALDSMVRKLRGADYELHIEGPDELTVTHPSVMLEAVNTSFQVHYQTTPSEFAAAYNTALAVAAPVMAVSVNAPILFGKRLWRETRIAIFQQVVDTRGEGAGARELLGRVRFGERWVRDSILEIFRADVARFRQVVAAEPDRVEDANEVLDAGGVPRLSALQAFNSCIYRWMRPCYGVTDGKPHLRIENRILPAGPTIEDETANAAFWIGLMAEGPHAWPDIHERMEFQDVRSNFYTAAREGLACHLVWLNGAEQPARELVLQMFLPAARRGLARLKVDEGDSDRLLGIIESRVESRQTGANWILSSVAKMRGRGTRSQRLTALTRAITDRQASGVPVHRWTPMELSEDDAAHHAFATVSQCMSTDLFTVTEDECIDLVASIMDWERLRHIPVEDAHRRLVGLVSYRILLRALLKRRPGEHEAPISVAEIMIRDPVTVSPDTPTLDAINLMCEHRVACLPVVEDGRLVGIVSERDYTQIARRLLQRALREDADP